MSFLAEMHTRSTLPMHVRGDGACPGEHGTSHPHSPITRSFASNSAEMHKYIVTIETGKSRWAGTEAEVRIQLFGEHGNTDAIPLREADNVAAALRYAAPSSSPVKFGFSEGSVREFKFDASFVGNLLKICVFHGSAEDHDHAASWRLERVVVCDDTLVRTWQFKCEMWLTRDSGNEVELYPSREIAAGRRASMRLSRRRTLGGNEHTPSSKVALLANRFSNNNAITAAVSTNASEGGVRRVCFQLQKDDMQKGFMYLYGEIPALGSGDPSRALRMVAHVDADGKWRGEWRLELEIDDDYDTIEYRYIHVDEARDRACQSDKPCSLKLSDVSCSANRTVEGGIIYVKDTFKGTTYYRSPSRLAIWNQKNTGLGDAVAPIIDSKALSPSPPRRTNLGYREGEVSSPVCASNLDTIFEASNHFRNGTVADDSIRNTPETIQKQNRSTTDVRDVAGLESLEVVLPDSTVKLRDELQVTSSLLLNSRKQLQKKNLEIQELKENLDKYSETNSLTSLMKPSIEESERSSPISTESFPKVQQNSASPDDPIGQTSEPGEGDSHFNIREAGINGISTNSGTSLGVLTPPSAPLKVEKRQLLPAHETPRAFSISRQSNVSFQRSPTLSSRRAPSMHLLSAEKVRKDALDAQREIQNLRKVLDDLRLDMTDQCTAYESRQAELVRLVMDYNESRVTERKKLVKERDEIYASWTREYVERRKLFNTIQELRGNIRVFCRVRPLKTSVLKGGAPANLSVSFPNANLGDKNAIAINDKAFEFSHVFDPSATQEAVYNETSGVIGSVLDGYNVCVFAYGQTGSGKTHTMNGSPDDRGVNFRALTDLFAIVKERSDYCGTRITVSMIEIYNDALKDLIYDKVANGNRPVPKLAIRRDATQESKTAVHIPNLTEVEVSCVDEVWKVMEIGAHNRAMSATDMNQHSSRSHLILRVRVDMDNFRTGSKSSGLLSLVDLAGSERVGRSKAAGERLKEAQHINKSLATLGDVFTALLQKSAHVPYRNSKLTYLLQDSLGGDSKTLMFVNISCDESDSNETLSSLQFAQRVAKVELGSARKHTENTAASKALSTLNEKEAQNQSLRSENLRLQRDLKKREQALEEQREKLHQTEMELRNAAKHVDEKRKRETSEHGGLARELRELRRADDKREVELRSLKLKLREVARTKDDEMKKLKATVEEKDRKIRILESHLKTTTSRLNSDTGSASTPTSHSLSEFGSEPSLSITGRTRRRIPRGSTIGSVRSQQSDQSESNGTSRPLRRATAKPAVRSTLATRRGSSVPNQTTSEARSFAARRASRVQDNANSSTRRVDRLADGQARGVGSSTETHGPTDSSSTGVITSEMSTKENGSKTTVKKASVLGRAVRPSEPQNADNISSPIRRSTLLQASRRKSTAQLSHSSTVSSRMNRAASVPTNISTRHGARVNAGDISTSGDVVDESDNSVVPENENGTYGLKESPVIGSEDSAVPRPGRAIESRRASRLVGAAAANNLSARRGGVEKDQGSVLSGSNARTVRPPRHSTMRPPMRRAVSSLSSTSDSNRVRRASTYMAPSARARASRQKPNGSAAEYSNGT